MAKSIKEKGFVLGGAIVGLLMSGAAMGSSGDVTAGSGEYFKFNDLKAGYQLAAAEEQADEADEADEGEEEGSDEEEKEGGEKDCKGDKGCSENGCS